MTKRIVFILLLFSVIVTGYSQTTDYAVQIDSLLAPCTPNPFNGVVLISQNGKTMYSKVCGYSDFESNKSLKFDDRFVIGSISKQITAVIVLQEYEKGHLKLDEPVRTYLPELLKSWADTVTIQHLLTHMHGIVELEKPTAFPVGTQFNYGYSSLGYDLLTRIVEQTSGESFVELSKNLFAKCNMKNTFHPEVKKYISLVKGYTVQEDGKLQFDTTSFRIPVAAGAFISTAADLVLWNENLFGGKLLKKETFDLLTTKQPGAVRNHPVFGTTEYGLGITVGDQDGIIQWGQTGYTDGFVSMDFYFPETKMSVIVLENVVSNGNDTKKAFSYHVRILDIVWGSLLNQ
jgi:CubicO group peptidase (beta-lactamase class C family)